MQIECSDEGFFMLPPCTALWNLFKEAHILPFMYEKMLDYSCKIEHHDLESSLKTYKIDSKFYKELLSAWQNFDINKDSSINKTSATIHNDMDIYFDFLSTFIVDTIRKDCVKKYLNLQETMYKYIESLYSRNLYVELIFVDNYTMQSINNEYMSKDYPTDVLSFPLTTQDIEVSQCLGSIVINMYAVCDKADFYRHNMYAEISLLFIHAFLHILGFDHESDNGTQRLIEQEIITMLNLPKSLILRAE